jgi:hypothetical protein
MRILTTLPVAALLAAGLAVAEMNTDFSNPAVTLSSEAVIASGTCIAKYASILDDASQPAAQIGEKVAARCSREISRAAGLASWIVGKPEDFAKTLKYTREDLTTGTVERSRAAGRRR